MILDFFDFIRIRICFSLMLISVLGFTVYNPVSFGIAYVMIAAFFLCAGGYSYNNLTDEKEDFVNRGKVNPFVKSRMGMLIVVLCFLLGISASAFLSLMSFSFSLIFSLLIIAYSLLRLKRFMLLKNVYTSMLIAIPFMVGANLAALSADLIYNYLIICLFIAIGSIISDLRDLEGDRQNRIRTIPVVLGDKKSRMMIMAIIAVNMLLLLSSSYLVTLIPFALVILVLVNKKRYHAAHSLGSISFIFTLMYVLLIYNM